MAKKKVNGIAVKHVECISAYYQMIHAQIAAARRDLSSHVSVSP